MYKTTYINYYIIQDVSRFCFPFFFHFQIRLVGLFGKSSLSNEKLQEEKLEHFLVKQVRTGIPFT